MTSDISYDVCFLCMYMYHNTFIVSTCSSSSSSSLIKMMMISISR